MDGSVRKFVAFAEKNEFIILCRLYIFFDRFFAKSIEKNIEDLF